MESKSIRTIAKTLGGKISKNSPTILTCLAVGGVVTTAIFAAKATPKAYALVEEAIRQRAQRQEQEGVTEPFGKWDYIKLTWRHYLPAACMCAATIACIVGSNGIHKRRNAAVATAYGLTEIAFSEYKNKVVEAIGKNKELKVRDDISADAIKNNPPGKNEIIFTGKGEVLCYDSLSGRYFKSDIEQIRRAVNNLNKEFLTDMWMSVNDLYFALGLAPTKLGDQMGWDLDSGLIGIDFSTQLTENEEPCLVLNYTIKPRYSS